MKKRSTAILAVSALLVAGIGAALWQRAYPHRIHTSIDIDADSSQVWHALTAFAEYPEWNPSLVGMSGSLVEGGQLSFALDESPDAMVIEPTILRVSEEKELLWEGNLVVPGIFDGEHRFTLETLDGGGTRLIQSEAFRGILVPFMAGWLDDTTHPQFVAMNEALRDRVERP